MLLLSRASGAMLIRKPDEVPQEPEIANDVHLIDP